MAEYIEIVLWLVNVYEHSRALNHDKIAAKHSMSNKYLALTTAHELSHECGTSSRK